MAEPAQAIPAFNRFEIVGSGTMTIAKDAGQDTAQAFQSHSLGYAPTVVAWLDASGEGTTFLPLPYMDANTSGEVDQLLLISSLTTRIQLDFVVRSAIYNATPITYTVKYYMVRETAN